MKVVLNTLTLYIMLKMKVISYYSKKFIFYADIIIAFKQKQLSGISSIPAGFLNEFSSLFDCNKTGAGGRVVDLLRSYHV